MPVEDGTVVEVGVAALEDMDIVEEPRFAPSTKKSHQVTAAGDQSSPRHLPAPASDRKQERRHLSFPAGHGKTASELFSWFAALLKQHPDLQPLYKEGRNQPYITVSTDSSFYATLVSEGFLGLVMECPGEEGTHPVIIHGVATHINVNLIEVPAGFHGLKRRMVGQMARPQLLGVVTGKVPSEVHLLGLGRRRVERYTPEPDLCRHCSRWRHKEWRCQSAPRCRYFAGPYKSAQCLDKIKEGTKIPPRCCNCGGDHNAHSTLCTVRPRPQREPAKDEVSLPRLVFCQAPPPQTNAWVTKPSFSATGPHLSQPSCPTTGTSTTSAMFLPLPQRTATVPLCLQKQCPSQASLRNCLPPTPPSS
ncbi:uncharacterized protein LOC123514239 [Portunus trituberculatus]|uniref:uncharacterized protein LOC123514239 n=1 Tax=Portunus trituberculatus TaxID=210409 RepID=UPI001E1CF34C|nr:uncharacterized protein LOC123514239 [Portunus trituberculatus]XP_045127903.1 uncharacterized protein LOC123514239 [Portunus trituberculatus]